MSSPKPSTVKAIARAIQRMGGPSKAAQKLGGIAPQNFYHWMGQTNRNTKVPPEHCVDFELETEGEVTRKQLRPDDWWRFWPELPGAAAARQNSRKST